jgi:hypothetical protein
MLFLRASVVAILFVPGRIHCEAQDGVTQYTRCCRPPTPVLVAAYALALAFLCLVGVVVRSATDSRERGSRPSYG